MTASTRGISAEHARKLLRTFYKSYPEMASYLKHLKEQEMIWKTDIPELIKTLVDGVECEYETFRILGLGPGAGVLRYKDKSFQYHTRFVGAWKQCDGFGRIERWRPARTKILSVKVSEDLNGIWSWYTGTGTDKIYVASKPDLLCMQALDEEHDYSEAKVQYNPYPRAASIHSSAREAKETAELWIDGKRYTRIQAKPKVGRINVSVYYDHVSISFMHVRCHWSGTKCPSMADLAAAYPDLDFSEACFIVNE